MIEVIFSSNIVFKMDTIRSTVGIECSHLKLSTGELNVWDFGGQLEYTTTHGFFLSLEVCHIECLYVVLYLTF